MTFKKIQYNLLFSTGCVCESYQSLLRRRHPKAIDAARRNHKQPQYTSSIVLSLDDFVNTDTHKSYIQGS